MEKQTRDDQGTNEQHNSATCQNEKLVNGIQGVVVGQHLAQSTKPSFWR